MWRRMVGKGEDRGRGIELYGFFVDENIRSLELERLM